MTRAPLTFAVSLLLAAAAAHAQDAAAAAEHDAPKADAAKDDAAKDDAAKDDAAKDDAAKDDAAKDDGDAAEDHGLAPKSGPALYVVDPKIVNMAKSVGATVSSLIAKTAEHEGFRVFTRDDAKVILGQSADLQELGGDADGASLSELGKAVGANHVVAAVVSAVDQDIVVQARLIDVKKAAVVSRREVKASDFGGALVAAVEAATRLALQPVFADQRGVLTLKVSEEGANVTVDDSLVGVTPLEKPLELAGGHHLLVVEKKGFIRHAEDVKVTKGATLARDVRLRPSVEFLEDYRAKNGLYRTLAWTTTIAGGALAVAAGGLAVPYALKSQEVLDTTAEYNAIPDITPEKAAEGNALVAQARDEAALWSYAAAAAGSGALIAGGAAAYFWIFGDDPARYDGIDGPAAE